MTSFLISYEYKEKNGSLIEKKTNTRTVNVKTSSEFNKVIENIKSKSYQNYMKVLFCQRFKID